MNFKYRFSFVIVIIVLITVFLPCLRCSGSGLKVEGAYLVTDVSPGEKIVHKITITIPEGSGPEEFSAGIENIDQTPDGILVPLDKSRPASYNSAREFISLDKSQVSVAAGKPASFSATIKLPSKVDAGGYYALITLKSSVTGNNQIGVASAVNVPIFLTVKDSTLIHTGEIREVSTGDIASGNSFNILTTFKNTGNHHYKVKNEVEIKDINNKLLDTISTSLSSSIIPSMSRQIKATYQPQGELVQGVYKLVSRLRLEDGALLDEAEGQFEVKAPYVPPAAPVNLTLKPSKADNLISGDGRINIEFLQGSVSGDTPISLLSFPPEQLPGIPEGYISSSTCFKIDGLTGLLLKPAVIRVKYSSIELEKAGGDASRLILARWDETGSEWTLLKTGVDSKSQILSSETNQFSLWTILIGPPSSNKINWPVIAIACILGLVIILAAAILKPKGKKSKL